MKYRDLLEKIQSALHDENLHNEKRGASSEPQSHSYAQATALRVPKSIPRHAVAAKAAHRKTDIVTKEWNNEVKQTSNCSSHIEQELTPGTRLIPERVHRWNIKNYSSIARKMQMLVKTADKDMTEQVSVIASQEDQTAQADKNRDELWRDMMKVNEERHFRIGRIINYFS
jgi:hypothetical protein